MRATKYSLLLDRSLKINKSEIVRWAGDIERKGKMTNSYAILVGKTEVILQIERPKLDGMMMLKDRKK
jgi:hypothetical protein